MTVPFITRVTVRNYKSIASCKVDLQSLMFLVGLNGSGKSSFLDSIKFVADSLSTSLDHALRERGTIKEVRQRSGGHPTHFSIRLDFHLATHSFGHFSFRIGTNSSGEIEVCDEECKVVDARTNLGPSFYRIKNGNVVLSSVPTPATVPNRLALVNFAGNAAFRPVFDALTRIEVYNLNPSEIGMLQKIESGEKLRRDGSNAASVLRSLSSEDQSLLNSFLGEIVPGVREVETKPLGSFETVEFRQSVMGQKDSWRFLASSMSDGTLRSFGVLLATLQSADSGPLLIGIEEPETAVHPSAARILLKALRFASERRQVLVTSHSPDLLDDPDLPESSLLDVQNIDGTTYIGGLDDASKEAIRDRLLTAGELLRQNQLSIAKGALKSPTDAQLSFFEIEETK